MTEETQALNKGTETQTDSPTVETQTEPTTGNVEGTETPQETVPREKYEGLRTRFETTLDDYKSDAKLFKDYKEKYNVTNEQFQSFLEDPDSSIAPTSTEEGGDDLESRLIKLEKQIATQKMQEAENREWSDTATKRPEMAPFKSVIMNLGKTDSYKKKSYEQIFDEMQSTFTQAKQGVQAQQKTEGVASLEDGITLSKFRTMSKKDKLAYLKKRGIMK